MNLEPEETYDDQLLAETIIPAAVAALQRQFGLDFGTNEVEIEFRIDPWVLSRPASSRVPILVFPSDLVPQSASDLVLSYYDCETNPSTPAWVVVPTDRYEVVLNGDGFDGKFLRVSDALCGCCLACGSTGLKLTSVCCGNPIYKVNYVQGSNCDSGISDIHKAWCQHVIASMYRNRETEIDSRLVESPVFKRLTALGTRYRYPSSSRG